jgi:hypothetical protein
MDAYPEDRWNTSKEVAAGAEREWLPWIKVYFAKTDASAKTTNLAPR